MDTERAEVAPGGPADEAQIDETIQRALRPGAPPPYDELVTLEQTLLLIIADLYAVVAERLLCPREQASLTAIRRQTAVGLGSGLVSAHQQVRALARNCQWLLEQKAGARP
ncbi:DUF6415 family natural product biosynthesis protein [Streptomyces kronopolitis]|uniref:DUF6415 family natural product biosynthesis protein n=1 Tax=Streptomyces kronopolitis TaxID=1612435 RepID=UPI00341847CC